MTKSFQERLDACSRCSGAWTLKAGQIVCSLCGHQRWIQNLRVARTEADDGTIETQGKATEVSEAAPRPRALQAAH
jgi:uncharacterized Zn finger protein (UPF0148 family)